MNIISRWQSASVSLLSLFFILLFPWQVDAETTGGGVFSIDDYFKVNRITELALSSDGEWIAYRTVQQSLEKNQAEQKVFIIQMKKDATPVYIEDIQNAQSFSWIPGTHKLAFLAAHEEIVQVQSFDVQTKKKVLHTNSTAHVIGFKFSPTGAALAYLSRPTDGLEAQSRDDNVTIHDRLYNGETGFVIDSDTNSLFDFIDPSWGSFTSGFTNNATELWLITEASGASKVSIPGGARDIHWADDGERLSVSYLHEDMRQILSTYKFTSIGVFDIRAQTFDVVAEAKYDGNSNAGVYYKGGEWVPARNIIHLKRIEQKEAFGARAGWSLIDLNVGKVALDKVRWRPIHRAPEEKFIAASATELYLNTTLRAVTALYALGESSIERAEIINNVDGSAKLFQFSNDFQAGAFVNESLTTPPEIFVWRADEGVKKITSINEDIAIKRMPHAREVTWRSKDGTTVQGWLLTPSKENDDNEPWPLITFVMGGPGIPNNNEFAYTFLGLGGFWPYPFEAYANNGLAVLLPNYRGASTFGPKFYNPSRIDGEPVDDIIAGIEHLIEAGIADKKKLAISGHSHGAWLAPLVMTKYRNFSAASFAEGNANSFTNYAYVPHNLNKGVHDIVLYDGKNIYDSVERAVEISPLFHFQGLRTAVLFEAGVNSLGAAMLDHPKAALDAGMPTEYIVYPRTGHAIHTPSLQKEAAERNLDWMQFWLLGEEDSSPAKQDQYARWRKMQSSQK